MEALAYVNHGRWVIDCPHTECNNAYELKDEITYVCNAGDGCFSIISIVWPLNKMAITVELGRRHHSRYRNWFPVGHPWASRIGQPMGQTVQELAEEYDTRNDVKVPEVVDNGMD